MSVRQRRAVGAILKVPLDAGWHAYAWTLPEADFAFFDIRTAKDVAADAVVQHAILFRVAVHKSAWTTGRWLRVGLVDPPHALMAPVPKFMKDILSGEFSIYLGGSIRKATQSECTGLERAAVWDPEHVEDRLRDHFEGLPNKWVQSLALR